MVDAKDDDRAGDDVWGWLMLSIRAAFPALQLLGTQYKLMIYLLRAYTSRGQNSGSNSRGQKHY